MSRLEPATVAAGAGVALAIAVPPAVAVRVLAGPSDEGSPAWFLVVLAFLVSFPVAGGFAARRAGALPLRHAAAATAAAFFAAVLVAVIRNVATGRDMGLPALVTGVLFLQIAVSLGVVGGLLARRRSARMTKEETTS